MWMRVGTLVCALSAACGTAEATHTVRSGALIPRAPHHADVQCVGPAAAKRDAQGEGQHNGEAKYPEDRFRLPVKLARTRQRELHQGIVTHRAAGVR